MATFCLLHGNWHDGSCWEPLAGRLRERGHEVLAPDLPFDDPDADYEERARPALEALDGVAHAVVVGHSVASPEAAIVAARRSPALLVYLCARFGTLPTGPDAPSAFRADFPFPPKDDRGRLVWDEDAAIAAMYARLGPETAHALARRLRPGASARGDYPLTDHPRVSTAVIYTTDDEFFEPAWEQYVAREVLGVEPVELPGGHFPMVEQPDALAGVLDNLARRT